MTTFCQDCKHLYEKKGPSWTWLCTRFKCVGGEGFVTREHWDDDPPYRKCRDINKHGVCPLYEERKNDEHQ